MPEPDELILGGDLLLLQGRPEDLDALRGLQGLDQAFKGLGLFDQKVQRYPFSRAESEARQMLQFLQQVFECRGHKAQSDKC